MSQENVEIVRGMYDAYARGDYAKGLSYLDPKIVFSQPAEEPGGGTFHGHEGVIEAFGHWTGEWEDYRVELEDMTDRGDRVLATTLHHGRGTGSGAKVELRIYQLWEFAHGKIVRATMYYDEGEAIEALRSTA